MEKRQAQLQLMEDAISFLDQVKLTFINQPQVFNAFLDILKEVREKISIDVSDTVVRVFHLLRDHQELVNGFFRFIPVGRRI